MDGANACFLALFFTVWLPRIVFGFGGYRLDVSLYLAALSLSGALHAPSVYTIAILPVVFVVPFIIRSLPAKGAESGHGSRTLHQPKADRHHPFKPLILPCQTSHARLLPNSHTFSYSYLQVGVPVGWSGCVASMVATDLDHRLDGRRLSWSSLLQVDAADHLDRNTKHADLRSKLNSYIESQGHDPDDYPHAYLVTAPRFLGYCFNPVSFWYLYSGRLRLSAMILEVNNTFDERRMYFLKSSEVEASSKNSGDLDRYDSNFTTSWPKDFHVSPFNSRKGSYSLSASDPFSLPGGPLVNNTITLSSSKNHPKMVARLVSNGAAIHPSRMTVWQKLRFVMAWWWVGFLTYPRIVKEASKLYFRKKLHVWFRPEVAQTSIGRRETPNERAIEVLFRRYLSRQITKDPLRYISSGVVDVRTISFPRGVPQAEIGQRMPTLQILTPLFYTQLALCPDPASLVSSVLAECENHRTVHVLLPSEVVNLLRRTAPRPSTGASSRHATWSDDIRWWILGTLCPHQGSRPLDDFVRAETTAAQATKYMQAVVALRASHWLAAGIPELLNVGALACRLSLCWLSAKAAVLAAQRWVAGEELLGREDLGWKLSLATMHLWLTIEGAMAERRGY